MFLDIDDLYKEHHTVQWLNLYDFVAGASAANDSNICLGDMELFRQELDECGVGLAIVCTSVQIHCKLAGGGLYNFFLRAAGFDKNRIYSHVTIIHLACYNKSICQNLN